MAWPTGADIQQRTDIVLSYNEADEAYVVDEYGLDVTQMILDAIAACAAYCHRERYGFDEAEVTETLDGDYCIQVAHPPVMSVSSLTWDGTTLTEDDDEFEVYDRMILIPKVSTTGLQRTEPFDLGRKIVVVTYTGGYSDTEGATHRAIPRELKSIVREMVVRELLRIDHQYREMKGVRRYAIGESSADFSSDNRLMSDLYARLARGPWEVTGIA